MIHLRPLEKLAVGLLLSLWFCGCTFSKEKKEDEHLAVQEHAERRADEHEIETKQTGPETITTTIEEYEDGDHGMGLGAAGGVAGSGSALGAPVVAGRAAPPAVAAGAPRFIRRTVIVDQRGPVVETKAREIQETGSEDVGLNMTRRLDTESKTSPALAGYLWMLAAAAAVAGIGWAAWKFSLPGKILGLLK